MSQVYKINNWRSLADQHYAVFENGSNATDKMRAATEVLICHIYANDGVLPGDKILRVVNFIRSVTENVELNPVGTLADLEQNKINYSKKEAERSVIYDGFIELAKAVQLKDERIGTLLFQLRYARESLKEIRSNSDHAKEVYACGNDKRSCGDIDIETLVEEADVDGSLEGLLPSERAKIISECDERELERFASVYGIHISQQYYDVDHICSVCNIVIGLGDVIYARAGTDDKRNRNMCFHELCLREWLIQELDIGPGIEETERDD